MTLDFPVKIINGPGLEDILNFNAILSGNIEAGVLELSRQGADLPFSNWPWQELKSFDSAEKGKISKKKYLFVNLTNGSTIELELLGKINLKEVVLDLQAFKNAAEAKFPKGGMERAVESLQIAKKALLDAVGQMKSVAMGKLSAVKSGLKNGLDKVKK